MELRRELRAWLDAHITPEVVAAGQRPVADETLETLRAWNRQLADAGWAAPTWPVEHGGRAADLDRLVPALRPDGPRRAQAPGHQLPIGRPLQPRHRDSAAAHHDRRRQLQRAVLQRRARSGQCAARSTPRRLDRGDDHAQPRAGRCGTVPHRAPQQARRAAGRTGGAPCPRGSAQPPASRAGVEPDRLHALDDRALADRFRPGLSGRGSGQRVGPSGTDGSLAKLAWSRAD
jgi:Acyl-CoA dehydrogenase, N-terminal domain